MLSGLVPTWTLLAALTAGLILGVLASRLFSSSPTAPAVPPAQEPALLAEPPAAEVASQEEPAAQPAATEESRPEPEPAPAPAVAQAEPVRISMEDVVSELERRYQGRQAEAASEKPRPGGRRRRSR
jgi:hypothetical protein